MGKSVMAKTLVTILLSDGGIKNGNITFNHGTSSGQAIYKFIIP